MNFFGMTYVAGPHNSLKAKSVSALNMNDIDEERFIACFDEVDEDHSGFISIDELRILLAQVYQDSPPENEVKFLMELFDANRDGKISREEWQEAVPLLKQQRLHQDKDTTVEFKSAAAYRNAIRRNARLQYNPTDKFRRPVTASQEYGWYTPMPVEAVPVKSKKNCAETVYASEMIRSGIYF